VTEHEWEAGGAGPGAAGGPYDEAVRLMRLGTGSEDAVLRAEALFGHRPREEWTTRFLSAEGHHLLMAFEAGDEPVGFVSGVETTHPDKGTEMFLYELCVHPEHRNRGVGRSLVEALAGLARDRGCYGMWVATETGNAAALAAYRAAGAGEPDDVVVLDWTFDTSPAADSADGVTA
jgi:[ribosomal protein S18]-alanine N-acetyltransferase